MSTVMFDRVDTMRHLHGSCLAPGGKSAAIIGAQKVGKTHLLNHVYQAQPRPQDTLFCRVDVDMLKARLGRGASLSDDTFIRAFLKSLLTQVDPLVASQEVDEKDCRRLLQRTEAELTAALDAGQADLVKRLRGSREAYRKELNELEVLRQLRVAIQTMLRQPDPLTTIDLLDPVDEIARLGKRILLVIDEFHRMLEEKGFSEQLWYFLRGTNSEGTVVLLVTSTVSLMDPSLHGDADPAVDRPSLFNHFQQQPLMPFAEGDADGFLDWLALSEGVVLTPEEKDYLVRIGGGSPDFLKKAFDGFLARGQPDAQRRAELELLLAQQFEPGLHSLWRRCSGQEREMLRTLALGGAAPEGDAADRLERDGYMLRHGGQFRIFSPIFEKFVLSRDDWAGTEVEVRAYATLCTIPPSLFIQQSQLTEPLVTFQVKNPTHHAVRLVIVCVVQRYSDEEPRLVTVAPRSTATFALAPCLIRSEVATLRNPVNATVHCTARLMGRTPEPVLWNNVHIVQLLASDHFVFARSDPSTHELQHWYWLLAAWVTPYADALGPVVNAARAASSLSGYPASGDPYEVRTQAQALYAALASYPIHYDNSSIVFHQRQHDYAQRVRMPAQSLLDHAANCLDGSVLFASLLLRIGIHPVLLLLDGHAIVGWKTSRDPVADWEFIDTTLLDQRPFTEAARVGQSKYEEVRELVEAWRREPPSVFDPEAPLAIPVDIQAEIQKRKLIPLQ